MNMATPRNRIALRLIQLRRRYARQRMMRDLGWRTGWSRS